MYLPDVPASASHHDLGVSGGVLGDSQPVLGLLPLRRLVVDVGDEDGQVHGAAAVASVRRHDLAHDPGRLRRGTKGRG